MLEHLNNIIEDISTLKKENSYNLDNVDIISLENSITLLKNNLDKIDLEKVKMLSEEIYQLNMDNTFSYLTDHISNEFYAFSFILEQKIKEGKI